MVLMKIGRASFAFILGVSIIASIVVAATTASGLQPPSVLYFASLNINNIVSAENSTIPTNTTPTSVGLAPVAMFFYNFGIGMIAGIPILMYKLASLIGVPSLAPAAVVLGSIIQVFAIYYVSKVFWSFIVGGETE